MFARVMTADIPTDRRSVDAVKKVLEESALPAVAAEPGFKSVTFYFDRQNGKLMSVTLFESEAAMKGGHEGIKPARAGVLQKLGAMHMMAESFEVVAERKR